uniref:Uncharacterized protein n=1 Tax=Physcomitrium patens TaxID=3218 RepID=A0A2K1JGE1_PHYPA|nr:hypothetical protein PHYPA_018023 [Physcomitrium patens]
MTVDNRQRTFTLIHGIRHVRRCPKICVCISSLDPPAPGATTQPLPTVLHPPRWQSCAVTFRAPTPPSTQLNFTKAPPPHHILPPLYPKSSVSDQFITHISQ